MTAHVIGFNQFHAVDIFDDYRIEVRHCLRNMGINPAIKAKHPTMKISVMPEVLKKSLLKVHNVMKKNRQGIRPILE